MKLYQVYFVFVIKLEGYSALLSGAFAVTERVASPGPCPPQSEPQDMPPCCLAGLKPQTNFQGLE